MTAGTGELAARIEAFLDAHHVMALATVGDDGAHAASVMFARAGFTLYWTSDPQSRHSAHLERDARVTATIAPDYTDFSVIRGLQVAGRAASAARKAMRRARRSSRATPSSRRSPRGRRSCGRRSSRPPSTRSRPRASR